MLPEPAGDSATHLRRARAATPGPRGCGETQTESVTETAGLTAGAVGGPAGMPPPARARGLPPDTTFTTRSSRRGQVWAYQVQGKDINATFPARVLNGQFGFNLLAAGTRPISRYKTRYLTIIKEKNAVVTII